MVIFKEYEKDFIQARSIVEVFSKWIGGARVIYLADECKNYELLSATQYKDIEKAFDEITRQLAIAISIYPVIEIKTLENGVDIGTFEKGQGQGAELKSICKVYISEKGVVNVTR